MDTSHIQDEIISDADARATSGLLADALLHHPTRSQILALLAKKPGLNKLQMAKELGVFNTTIAFHVKRLVHHKLIETRTGTDGRGIVCFLPEHIHLWENPGTRILFGRGSLRRVATYMAANPGSETKKISQALGLSDASARRHIRTLEKHGLVHRIRIDRQVICHPRPTLMDWVEALARTVCSGTTTDGTRRVEYAVSD